MESSNPKSKKETLDLLIDDSSIKPKQPKMYSKAELKLIEHFGFSEFLNQPAMVLYRMMADEAFAYNLQGPEVEALRRGFYELCFNQVDSKFKRFTPEWDELIKF